MSLTGLLLLMGLFRSTGRRRKAELDFERQSQIIRESKRRKIAGQLHDDLGQLITSFGLHQYGLGGSGFAKVRTGVLTLSGTNNVLDSVYVGGGTIRQTGGGTSAVELVVGTGQSSLGNYILEDGINQFAGNELVPVPEPGTWVGAGLNTVLAGSSQRRRLRFAESQRGARHSARTPAWGAAGRPRLLIFGTLAKILSPPGVSRT